MHPLWPTAFGSIMSRRYESLLAWTISQGDNNDQGNQVREHTGPRSGQGAGVLYEEARLQDHHRQPIRWHTALDRARTAAFGDQARALHRGGPGANDRWVHERHLYGGRCGGDGKGAEGAWRRVRARPAEGRLGYC